MNSRTIRALAPMLYGIAVGLTALLDGPVAIVAIVGAMLLGAMYVAIRPDVPADYDRSAARAERRERRTAR